MAIRNKKFRKLGYPDTFYLIQSYIQTETGNYKWYGHRVVTNRVPEALRLQQIKEYKHGIPTRIVGPYHHIVWIQDKQTKAEDLPRNS